MVNAIVCFVTVLSVLNIIYSLALLCLEFRVVVICVQNVWSLIYIYDIASVIVVRLSVMHFVITQFHDGNFFLVFLDMWLCGC